MHPTLTDAEAGALMVAHLFKGDYSEASLEIVDAIMSTADMLRQDADAAAAAIRKTFPHENLTNIERLLRIAAVDDSKCLALCGGYAGEVACRNLGATWSEQNGSAGVKLKEGGRFVALIELCTGEQYALLKAEIRGGAGKAPETTPATPEMQTATPRSTPSTPDMRSALDAAQASSALEYFEDQKPPTQGGFCSDRECPCDSTPIPVGEGYLYIPSTCCDFRQDCRSQADLRAKMELLSAQTGQTHFFLDTGVAGPIMVCEVGARRRNLDLAVAAADAKHWWATGQVPLRPTPANGQPEDLVFEAAAAPPPQATREPPLTQPKPQQKSAARDFPQWREKAGANYRGLAKASLICGLIAPFLLFFIPSLLAIALGTAARIKMRGSQNFDGADMALAGIVIGWIGIALGVGLLFFVPKQF